MIGCDINRLDDKPLDQISGESVWQDPSLMRTNLNDIYIGMGTGLFNSTSGLSVLSDDAMWTNGAKKVMQAQITPDDMGLLGDAGRFNFLNWGELYSRIRQTNIFLQKTADYSDDDKEQIERMRGQAYFLRAYFYMNLMRMFGGVPLIKKVYELDSKDFMPPRNSFKETISFIVENADSAAAYLPQSYTSEEVGRATKGAAMALKARVLLYGASDSYSENPSGMKETGYINSSNSEHYDSWKKAQKAAKEVIDLGNYHLYKANPGPEDSTAENYANIFLDQPNDEIIMAKHLNHNLNAPNVGMWQSPNGYEGWGENSPIQQLVDSYEMEDGTKFSWDNKNEAAHPYRNRDPRFYATILYDGAQWLERYSDLQDSDPEGIIQTVEKLSLPDGSTLPGLDTRDVPVQDWNGSYSGYYLRKFIDPTVDHKENEQEIPWPFFRYAEVLLNYAEASIELGEDSKARDAINKIRVRAGMPKLEQSVSGDELREKYRNERRIEMTAELQRFFDVRRWMIAPQVLDENAKGIKITVKGDSRSDRSSYHDYQYKPVDVRDRRWNNKLYFAPIPRREMNRNENLKQNPGY